jgi:hypothetical protein
MVRYLVKHRDNFASAFAANINFQSCFQHTHLCVEDFILLLAKAKWSFLECPKSWIGTQRHIHSALLRTVKTEKVYTM